jgi:hypothetical protein
MKRELLREKPELLSLFEEKILYGFFPVIDVGFPFLHAGN